MKLGGCRAGEAKITGGYNLPCKYIIHTVGPKWKGGQCGEKELLESCYRNSLKMALENKCESVAFPLISSGAYGYPKDQALRVAVDAITQFLLEHEMLVYIVVFDKSTFQISEKLFSDIATYIDDKYVDTHFEFNRSHRDAFGESELLGETRVLPSMQKECETARQAVLSYTAEQKMQSPDEMLEQIDESFSEMLLRKIDEKGMKDSECYKKANIANIDRKLFSKIRSDKLYRPSKQTAIAFAVALELSLDETKEMLAKAGFALSHSKSSILLSSILSQTETTIFLKSTRRCLLLTRACSEHRFAYLLKYAELERKTARSIFR